MVQYYGERIKMGETRILERWQGKTFSCKEFLLWLQSDEVPQPVHVMYGAFQRLKKRGYIIHTSGVSGGTVYRMIDPAKENPMPAKIECIPLDDGWDAFGSISEKFKMDGKTPLYIMLRKKDKDQSAWVSTRPVTEEAIKKLEDAV